VILGVGVDAVDVDDQFARFFFFFSPPMNFPDASKLMRPFFQLNMSVLRLFWRVADVDVHSSFIPSQTKLALLS